MTFTTPVALVLLLAIPLVIYLGFPRYAYRRLRDSFSLVLRITILLLLVFALAGLQIVRASDRLGVVFLVDASDSMSQTAQAEALEYIRSSLELMSPDDLAGVVLFGANATVERQLNAVRELGPVRSTPATSNTDFAEAIRLGLALFPPDTARRMVILSDGLPTVGDTEAAAQLAAAAGVEISYVPFERQRTAEVQVSDVRVPGAVNAGQEFDLTLTVDSDETTQANITVYASGEIIHQQGVNLEQGANNYTLMLTAGGSGFRDFRVTVDPVGGDGFFQNNQLSTFSQVIGPPRVLIVTTDENEARYIRDALTQSGLSVDVAAPTDLPIGIAPLAQYNSVILANVPASRLSNQRMEILQTYVRDLGGGLVVIGGPNTYGPGGYFRTPLEETIPLDMRLVDQQRVPMLTIVYVIDRSGSMSMVGPSGVENVELAKEAIIRSIEFLQPTDRAGVISFDTGGTWLVNLQPVFDRLALQTLVAQIRAGGGTDILAGMNTAAQALANDPSPRKHIILLTDGGADPTGLVELTGDLYTDSDVTTSVIAIGVGSPAQTFLDEMAQAGGGNFHMVDLVEAIPTIFTIETVLATRSYIIEEQFFPTVTSRSPILEGITEAPPLLGYVATSPKATAQVILRGPEEYNDPLLAAWQYGLGRSVAFTSDATGRWSQAWVGWDGFSQFWSQAVRWTITEGAGENLETRVVMEGEQARVIVEARDDEGGFLNGLSLNTSLIDPELEAVQVPLRQVAPGRYEAVFTPDAEGAYFLAVTGGGGGSESVVQVNERTGWVMSYSPEYSARNLNSDFEVLGDLATLTGGRSLAEDPGAVFAHNLAIESASTPVYPWLLLIALLLLPIDIAVRRLIITRSDWRRLREVMFGGRQLPTAPAGRMADLMGAKARAQQRTDEATSATSTAAALRSRKTTPRSETPAAPTAPTSASAEPRRKSPPPSPGQVPAGESGNIAGRLLQKKKDRDQ
jgi:uncharacterized membrane protein